MKYSKKITLIVSVAILVSSALLTGHYFKYNYTKSVKVGWYYLNYEAEPVIGDYVLFPAPERAYKAVPNLESVLPKGTLLLKQIIAVDGDQVCSDKKSVTVNGHSIAHRLPQMWRSFASFGCSILAPGTVYVIGHTPASLDSRFYGAIETNTIKSKGEYIGTFSDLF
jgi:type IV secretory pathway protease TraF